MFVMRRVRGCLGATRPLATAPQGSGDHTVGTWFQRAEPRTGIWSCILSSFTRMRNAIVLPHVDLPRPPKAGRVLVAGPDPDTVLLLGGGPTVGWGATIHELGVPGFFARWLTAATGRGAEVSVLADRSITVRTARRALDTLDLEQFDYVVLTLGVEDAVNGIRPAAWNAGLTDLLLHVRSACAAQTEILVAGIQPVRSIPIYDHPRAEPADARAQTLNRLTAAICAEIAGVTFVPMTGAPGASSEVGQTKKNYSRWAWLLVKAISIAPQPEGSSIELRRSGRTPESTPTAAPRVAV